MNTADEVSNEVRILLENDETALGQVYVAWHESGEDKTLQEISDQADIPYGTVAAKIQIIKQLFQISSLPSTTAQCIAIAKDIKRFKNRSTHEISENVSLRIDGIIGDLLAKSEDPNLVAKERKENIRKLNLFNEESGIYVYTYPHYRTHPAVESTDDTPERYHLKVGKTIRDPNIRVKEQTAGMPENPIPLLLIVGNDNIDFSKNSNLIDEIERQIHEHLETIGHARIRIMGGGKEWFLSNKETLISIADLMGLLIQDPDDQSQTDN